jgi:sugar/nucleoside kinase (ribokinase family)
LKPVDVVCVGNLVADVIVKPVNALPPSGELRLVDSIDLRAGGCALTTAIGLAQLGANVIMAGFVGNDPFGRFLEEQMDEAGVHSRRLGRHPTLPTSTTAVLDGDSGEHVLLHTTGATAGLTRDSIPDDLLFAGRVLHVAGAGINPGLDGQPTADLLAEAQDRGILTSLDTAFDSTGHWTRVHAALPHLDVFAPSLHEVRYISGLHKPEDIANWARDRGVKTVIIKLGSDGAFVMSEGFTGFVPSHSVPVLDTTGAGESFNAGLLYSLVRGWPTKSAVLMGTAMGALAVSRIGAVADSTSVDDVLQLAGLKSDVSRSML